MKEKFKNLFKSLPERKGHIEFITALLSIPVLISVVTLNVINLQNKSKPAEPLPTKAAEKIIIQNVTDKTSSPQQSTKNQITQPSCKKEVGPVEITSPKEGEKVSTNPVFITIKYDNNNYCSVVWSYRINNGNWSDYNSNSPSIYNLPEGDIKFDLRVQSTVSQDQANITRNFTYEGKNNLSPSPTASSSSSLN
ncbi:MAG: hypothetical protein M1450_01055 [Patescibacteria group bacterium]|nr:hypothetical protein [Patescibacteria group bacterium]